MNRFEYYGWIFFLPDPETHFQISFSYECVAIQRIVSLPGPHRI